ncbi:MAG: hypothetical protein IJQ84_07310 [Paludibacteraceae bacterium]|nr:hypothetical protein [Paludibacteraceae bacterium]
MKRFWSIVFVILLALPMMAQEELCMDGTLLFREDFGGNDPSDPEVISDANDARAAVPGMSPNYTPCLSRTSGMSSGKFLVTKQGYQNGIQWHIMDDHTYPNDKTKGYLLQIDGRGDDAPFYTTMIEGLCPGIRLTFSAYVANVMTWGHYTNPNRHDIYPRMKFVLTDPSSGTELATYDTGDIPFDSAFIGDNSSWQYSAHWRLIGMNFTVPDDTYRVKLTIYNNVSSNGSGNDFVLDDFEIHLCAPPVTIEGEAEVCMNETATLTANFENDGTFAEPLAYKWWHSTDSVTWSEISGFNGGILTFNAVQKNDSGWYKVAVSSDGNIENINCRAMSELFRLRVNECAENLCIDGTLLFREDFGGNDPSDLDVSMASVPGMDPSYHNSGNSLGSGNYTLRKEGWHNGIQWHWQDDHTYFGDKTRGYLLEVDGIGGAKPFYSKTIDGLCAGSKLTFSAYVVNVHYAGQLDYFGSSYVYPRMKFVLKDPTTGSILAEKSTGDIQPDWRYGTPETWKYARENKLSAEWQLIGMNFVVPDGIESIQMFIYNDVERNGSGNDFALDDIEVHLCAPPVTIEGETEVCENTATTLTANFTNDGTFAEPLAYKWWHSLDSVTWTEISGFNGENLLIDAVQKSDSGWYKVAVSGDGNIESVNCRAMSEPFQLKVNECTEDLCIDGILLFREDFGGNDPNDPVISTAPVPGMSYTQIYVLEPGASAMGSGRYLVAKEGYRNSTLNNYSLWHIMDDHTYPGDKTRGYLLEVDGKGGTQAFYETTMDGLCPGTRLTFSAYIANLETAGQYVAWKRQGRNSYLPQISFVITDPVTGAELARHNTDTIAHDWNPSAIDGSAYKKWQESAEWQLVGMHFTVPDGVSAVKLSILNNVRQDTGNDFALDDIEVHLCLPNPVISGESEVCQDSALSLTVEVTNDGTMAEPLEYKWWHSTDSLNWSEISGFNGENLLIDAVQKSDSGWYKVAVSADGNIESVNCRAMSEPFRLNINECEPPVPPCPELITITADTMVCDTLMPYRWRDTLFTEPATYEILYKDQRGCDSLLRFLTLNTRICCPNVVTITADTTVCDTLMPFTWTIGGQIFVFEQAETQERGMPHPKWTECTDTNYVLRLDTFHCEKLWQIIVNKYNWQLLLDNVSLSRFFPQNAARTYQWYKNEVPIPGANDDDYSEQNELCGRFQLRVGMDNGQTIWSNILEIGKAQVEEPIRVRIYDSHGVPVQENQVSHGVYLYRYEQGDRKWTEKRLIP